MKTIFLFLISLLSISIDGQSLEYYMGFNTGFSHTRSKVNLNDSGLSPTADMFHYTATTDPMLIFDLHAGIRKQISSRNFLQLHLALGNGGQLFQTFDASDGSYISQRVSWMTTRVKTTFEHLVFFENPENIRRKKSEWRIRKVFIKGGIGYDFRSIFRWKDFEGDRLGPSDLNYNRHDLVLTLGLKFGLTEKFYVNLDYNRGLITLYDTPQNAYTPKVNFFTFGVEYVLGSF